MTAGRAILAILGRFAATYPWRLGAGILLVAGATAAGIGLLAVAGGLIAGAALAGAGLITFDLFRPSSQVRFFAVARTLARYAERMATHDATLRFIEALRIDAFRGLSRDFRGTERPTVMFNRLTGDLDALDGLLIRLAIPVVAGLLVLAGAAVGLAAIDPLLAAAIVLPIAAGGILAPLLVARPAARHMRVKLSALDAARVRITDLDRGRAALAASGALAERVAGAVAATDRAGEAEAALVRLDTVLRTVSGLGAHAGAVGAAAAGLVLIDAGRLEPIGFTAVLLVSFALSEAVAPLRAIAIEQGRWAVAARRLAPLLAAGDAAVADRPGARAGAPEIRLAGVTVRGGSGGSDRLAGVDLTLPRGSVTALVGPSGAGKSTLMALLDGRLRPDAGTVTLGPAGAVVAWLGQRTELFRGTVADNLRLADPAAPDERLRAVVAAAALTDALGPEGLDRRLGDEGSGLSGGERRRLALARLMLQDPDLVLLDEPTEGLDAATAATVFAAIATWSRGRTVVVATHRPAEAALADRVVTVEAGRVRDAPATAAVTVG